jgi:hypothetical protein
MAQQIAIGGSAWFKVSDKQRIACTVETRVGGAYQISLPGKQIRIVRRHQLVRRVPGSKAI